MHSKKNQTLILSINYSQLKLVTQVSSIKYLVLSKYTTHEFHTICIQPFHVKPRLESLSPMNYRPISNLSTVIKFMRSLCWLNCIHICSVLPISFSSGQ